MFSNQPPAATLLLLLLLSLLMRQRWLPESSNPAPNCCLLWLLLTRCFDRCAVLGAMLQL